MNISRFRRSLAASSLLLVLFPGRWSTAVPFPLPREMLIEKARAVDPAAYPGADAVVAWQNTDVFVEDSGLSRRREETVTVALSPAGVKKLSVIRLDHDPLTSRRAVDAIRIVRSSGLVETIDPSTVVDIASPKHGVYWPFRTLLVQIPSLQEGDAVALATTFVGFQIAYLEGWGECCGHRGTTQKKKGLGSGLMILPEGSTSEREEFVPPQRGEFYDVVLFGGVHPRVYQRYALSLPRRKPVQYKVVHGSLTSSAFFNGDRVVRVFEKCNSPGFPEEEHAMAMADSVPKLVLTTLDGWEAISRWFWETNEPSFITTPELVDAAKAITQGLRTDEEKVSALNRWVAHAVRYSGWSLGPAEGYTLHPGTMTLLHRTGVCKDKAGLLVSLMRAAGYKDTFAAMTMAWSFVEDVPTNQFNHAVVAWRRGPGAYKLIDPTWAPLSRLDWSNAEAEQHYLVGVPEGDRLKMTPKVSPDDNVLNVRVRSEASWGGLSAARVTVSGSGHMETLLRRAFGFRPMQDWEEFVRGMALNVSPAAQLDSLDVDPTLIEDLSRKFSFSFDISVAPIEESGTVPPLVTLKPASFTLFIDGLGFAENLLPPGIENRKRGLVFRCAKEIRYAETITLPGAFKPVHIPAVSFSNPQGSVDLRIATRKREVELILTIRFAERYVQPAALPAYAGVVHAVDEIKRAALILQPK